MGRNDICFCGSNKKSKKCHPDINENSLAAKIIKSHNKVDRLISEHQKNTEKNSKCHKGCSECCYHYFLITDCEFSIILNEINDWDNDKKEALSNKVKQYMDIFETEYPEIVTYLNTNHSGSKDIFLEVNNIITKTSFPCVFLEEEKQECLIYNVRPFICRTHGNVMQITNNEEFDYDTLNSIICNRIGTYQNADWLVNIELIAGNEHDYKNVPIASNKFIRIKEYPIFYHLYHNLFLEQLNFNVSPNLNLMFFSISEDEYARRIKRSLGLDINN